MTNTNHKPKIALMSYTMDNRKAKGIALYTRRLIEGLLSDNNFDFSLVHYDRVSEPLYQKGNEIIMPNVNLPFGSHFISQMLFFWKYRNNKFDIIHFFHPRLYPFYSFAPAKKIVVTMHGAGDITAPHSFVFSRFIFNLVLKYFHQSVDLVIVDSKDAKSEVVKHYGFSEDKVRVVYLGGGENFKAILEDEAKKVTSEKYKITEPYILDVSRLQPHKNIVRLIKAYETLRKDDREMKEKLVIVGNPTSSDVEEYTVAEKSEFSSDIIFIDYVDILDLNYLYSASEVFVFPSLDEGFGLPALEAMASGVPVITSNTTSLPEIVGDSAMTIDPLDIKAISEAIKKVLKDRGLKKKMIESGLRRASEFTWQKTVVATKNLYNELLK